MRTLSDVGNGRRLVDTFSDAVRYTPGLGWFNWDGTYWKPDVEEIEMRELAKRLAPIIASEVVNYNEPDKQGEVVKWAQQAKSNARLGNAIESASSDPRVQVNVSTWDSDEYLLGVANGVIDLRTGELLRGRPDLHITRRAPVAYVQGLRNTRWEQFIDYATGGDKELQDWLQRAAGYSLTGLRTYDVMFLVYGPPGSGKNTFVEALVKCLGTQEYAWPLDSSILAQGDGQSHGSDLYHWAELRGRRLVWVDELPDSERMKENSVKKLTGSSEISARSPGEKPFTFQSQAKLWVTTNHRPIINDDAMWRRIRPIPWSKVPESPDPELKAYIFDPEGALPAVLSWAVEGAIKLLGSSARDGLGWCSAVAEAADIYRKNEDRIGIFLSEETRPAEGMNLPLKALYAVYRVWSEERGERPMTQIAFQRKMADRGLEITGVGSRAEIAGHQIVPRVVNTTDVDWSMATRFAR
jgi:putative DNA primase/helicase